ncbi:pyridoxal phosphate-dependent decarboxylase family protein [Halobacillus mangrovi]|uniref:pyridoxal phosphate-dependent decarboxylase family protein n=1 Tax=Halobacillus mangrovi TaxID=402384 RepID=UPI003D985CFE
MITSYENKRVSKESGYYDSFFLHSGEEGIQTFNEQVDLVKEKLLTVFERADQPFKGSTTGEIKKELLPIMKLSGETKPFQEVLDEIGEAVLSNSLHVSHKKSIAHLHCPPLLTGVVAELMIGALNQSMDSWDQSPSATFVEEELIKSLAEYVRMPETADGVFTSGGTQSNYMGLLMARDAFCQTYWNHNVKKSGLPQDLGRMRIICSEEAHFTVKKSASQLGLGEQAVISVPTDENHRMCIKSFEQAIQRLEQKSLVPFCVVATCGTTDYGSIDPLGELADICQRKDLWLHIDAAYGGALLFSHSHYLKIEGMRQADSVGLDFHKLCYQPISCGLCLIKDRKHFQWLSLHADYLNPVKDEQEGILNLVNKSVQTTRRFDALKVLLTLKTLGTDLLGSMIDTTMDLAEFAVHYLKEKPEFSVANQHPELNTVVFQYQPESSENLCELNRQIQQVLYQEGKAVIAKTSVCGSTYLKFTLLNPRTTREDLMEVIEEIEQTGKYIMNGGY